MSGSSAAQVRALQSCPDSLRSDPSALPIFQERWPPAGLAKAFDQLSEQAAGWALTASWATVMQKVVDAALALAPNNEHERLQWASAAISMVVHLRVCSDREAGPTLVNDRRQRTRYSSYPTPPTVARVIANHLARYLAPGEATILDPTIEGAPILLECSRALAGRPVRLIGIDRNEAAIAACSHVFEHAHRLAPGEYLEPELICADALQAMKALGPIDALANNPPWGERERNGRESFAGRSDPFSHFVEIGLNQLRDGGPFGLVLPGQAATAQTAAPLRRRLTESCTIDSVTTLPTRCFPRATVRTILILGRKSRSHRSSLTLVRYRAQPLSEPTEPPTFSTCAQAALGSGGGAWLDCLTAESSPEIAAQTMPLSSLADVVAGIVPYRRGRGQPPQTPELMAKNPYTRLEPGPETVPLLRSRQVRRYRCLAPGEHIRLGKHLAYSGVHNETGSIPRVFVRELCGRDGALVAAVAPFFSVPRYGVFTIVPRNQSVDPNALTAILNSSWIAKYVRSNCDGVLKESFNRVRVGDLRRLPIPRALVEGQLGERLAAVSRSIANSSRPHSALLAAVDEIVSRAYEVKS